MLFQNILIPLPQKVLFVWTPCPSKNSSLASRFPFPRPPRNFQEPPCAGYGYFLELHIADRCQAGWLFSFSSHSHPQRLWSFWSAPWMKNSDWLILIWRLAFHWFSVILETQIWKHVQEIRISQRSWFLESTKRIAACM